MVFILSFFFFILLYYIFFLIIKDIIYFDRIKKINKDIPGPKDIPIFGSLLEIDSNNVADSLGRLYKKYGPIYRIRLGNVESVVLTGNEMLEECFLKNKKQFHERFVKKSRKENNGLDIIHSNNEYWHSLKNVVLLELTQRKIKSYQPEILKEVEKMTNGLYKNDNHIVKNLTFSIKEMLLNIMLNLVFGTHEDLNKKNKLIESITRFFKTSGLFIYSDYVPLLLPYDYLNLTRNNLFKDFKILTDYSKKIVDDYHVNYEDLDNQEIKDEKKMSMMECYYEKFKNGEIKYESVISSSTNLILAGTDSSANTLSFLIAALINKPEIQDKMYDEIINNLNSEDISNSDHSKCPYTMAVIKEAHRLFSVAPLSEPHQTSEDVEIMGYKIAKGTQIIQNLYSTHRSDEYWDDSLNFKPERFLNSQKPTYHFGIGIRSCLGKNFADYLLFVTIVSLIKKYRFENPFPNLLIDEEGTFGLVMNVKEYSVILKKR